MFVLSGYILWDEGTKFIPRNGISSKYYFGYAVALSGDKDLIGSDGSYENGDGSVVAYIFCRVDGGMAGGIQDCTQ